MFLQRTHMIRNSFLMLNDNIKLCVPNLHISELIVVSGTESQKIREKYKDDERVSASSVHPSYIAAMTREAQQPEISSRNWLHTYTWKLHLTTRPSMDNAWQLNTSNPQ